MRARAFKPGVGLFSIAAMRSLGAALVVALASGLAPQTKPSAAKVQQKARGRVDIRITRRYRRDGGNATPTQALSKQLGTLAAGVALAGVAAAPVNVFAEDAVAEAPASTTKAAGPAAGRTEFQRQLAALRETKPAAAKPIVREAPAAAPAPTKAAPKAAKAAKAAKKEAPAVADGAPRAADVSFDKPAAQKREGKVIKKAPSKPKSERDADAAKAKEAARVAAREKAAVCDLCGNQISVASRTCSMAWSFHAIDATSHPRAACVRWRGGARRSPYPNSLVDFPHRRPRPPRKLKLRPRPPRPRRRARRAPPRRPRRQSPRRLLRPPRARSSSRVRCSLQ